jgi:hypothetical protein
MPNPNATSRGILVPGSKVCPASSAFFFSITAP